MSSKTINLEDLVCMNRPEDVLEETVKVVQMVFPSWDSQQFRQTFADILRLFRGEYTGYCGCNICFHDLKHTTDCLMAMARLLHGAYEQGERFSLEEAVLGLYAALMHDTGYIQTADDSEGSGAKYTLTHVNRSIDFMAGYFTQNGYTETDFQKACCCLKCTGLDVKVDGVPFESPSHELIGKMLGTADLLGQMGDRTYLERLPFLYEEFREGGVADFPTEWDLFRQTPGFWEFTKKRFAQQLGGVDRFMRSHFAVRWQIDRDLYREAIERSMQYLQYLVKYHESDYHQYLSRDGLMDRLKKLRSARSLHNSEDVCLALNRAR